MAHKRSEFLGETVTPIIPNVSLGKPSFLEISVHVSPLSVLFHNAEPSPPLLKLYGVRCARHVEAYNILGLFGSKTKSTAPD